MATKKPATPKDEKLDSQDVDLFDVLNAIDRKDYDYYDRLKPEQQKKIVPFMLAKWVSAVKANGDVARYYVQSIEYNVNKYLFNEVIQDHPKLQWQMLCAASPGIGKQFHQWIPQIKERVTMLKDPAVTKDVKEYFKKIYTKASDEDINEISKSYVDEHKKKMYLASIYPAMKREDIDMLSEFVTDREIDEYEKARGNR